jgi:hypothetical protein
MRRKARMTKSEALQRESHWVLRDRIRRLPAKPPQERTHFLRKRGGFLFVTSGSRPTKAQWSRSVTSSVTLYNARW